MWDKHQIVEEPYDGKLSRTVLKPSRGSDAPAQVNYNYILKCFLLIDLLCCAQHSNSKPIW